MNGRLNKAGRKDERSVSNGPFPAFDNGKMAEYGQSGIAVFDLKHYISVVRNIGQ